MDVDEAPGGTKVIEHLPAHFGISQAAIARYHQLMVLTKDQQLAVEQGRPVKLNDGERTYYVISKQMYERLKDWLEAEEIDPSFYEFDDDQDS